MRDLFAKFCGNFLLRERGEKFLGPKFKLRRTTERKRERERERERDIK